MDTKEKILALLKLGYTYRWLGKICDVHHTTLSNWCNNNSELSPRIINRINKGLNEHLILLKQILE